MSASASLKLPPEKSVIKFKVGDQVKLSEADFVRRSTAFFAELEQKVFVSAGRGRIDGRPFQYGYDKHAAWRDHWVLIR
jgi:hypothetical protein